jgi:NADH dehydrogenase/NADH:ubiquinone oxidoreductase 75 kD subunit (chain G)
MGTIKLTIDNKEVIVPEGTTILEASKSVGIKIPTLCFMKLDELHSKIVREAAESVWLK